MKKIAMVIVAAMVAVTTFAQEKKWAVVELSTVYMRIQPDYESALETQELMGTVVEIVGEKGYWREIVSPQPYKAWVTEKGLVEMNAAELEAYRQAPKVMFTDLYGHVYSQPSFKSQTICDLVGGDIMRVITEVIDVDSAGRKLKSKAEKRGWTQVMLPSGKIGWVRSDCIASHKGFRNIAKGEGNADSISEKETEMIIAQALKLVGVPYLWGGMSAKGVDCSGLVRISHLMNGILLPRNASQQIHCGDKVEIPRQARNDIEEARNDKEQVDDRKEKYDRAAAMEAVSNLKLGDLVFFGTPALKEGQKDRVTHVGIYLGNGKIIHASHLVRINSLIPEDEDYYENAHRLLGAVRL